MTFFTTTHSSNSHAPRNRRRLNAVHRAMSVALLVAAIPCTSYAAISTSGDIDPNTDPATWTDNTDVSIGVDGVGSISIDGGSGILSDATYLGLRAGSQGTASVSGTGSNWTIDNTIFVGRVGIGSFTLSDGATVNSGEVDIAFDELSTGSVTVTGASTVWTSSRGIEVGNGGFGTLDILGGAVVNSNGGGAGSTIGEGTTATGVATVSGAGSRWISEGSLNVGDNGKGTLNILNGGVVRSDNDASYLRGANARANVNGVGSQWTSGPLNVGFFEGDATLTIENGGFVAVDGRLSTDSGGAIQLASGGSLALLGEGAGSLSEFYDLVFDTDTFRYWDPTLNAGAGGWNDLTNATLGIDYTLTYFPPAVEANSLTLNAEPEADPFSGYDVSGFTVLTVGVVPEPTSLAMLSLGGLLLARRRRA